MDGDDSSAPEMDDYSEFMRGMFDDPADMTEYAYWLYPTGPEVIEDWFSLSNPAGNGEGRSSDSTGRGLTMVNDDEAEYDVVCAEEVDSGYEMDSDDMEDQQQLEEKIHGKTQLNLETEGLLGGVTAGSRPEKKRLTAMDLILGDYQYFETNKTHLTAENHPDSGKKAISKEPWVGEKESMIVRITRYETSQFHIPPGLQRLGNQYSFYRRLLEDGSTFYRAFIHAYLEHILESRDVAEVARIKDTVKQCKLAIGDFGYVVNYDAIDKILEDLNKVIGNADGSVTPVYLLLQARAPNVSDYLVEFFRYATAAEIGKHYQYFKRLNVDPKSVLPMGSEADAHHIKAFCNALGVTIRIIYLDRPNPKDTYSSKVYGGNLHSRKSGLLSTSEGTTKKCDIQALVTLAFSGKKYDILYPKKARLNAENNAVLSKEFISRAPMQHEFSLRARADGAGNKDQIYGQYLSPMDTASDEKKPQMGDKKPMLKMISEYSNGSVYLGLLNGQYGAYRTILGDGNCFYSAFVIAYLEYIWESKDSVEVARVKESARKCLAVLENVGYNVHEFTNSFEAFYTNLDLMIDDASIGTNEELMMSLRSSSNILVNFARRVTSADMLDRQNYFRVNGYFAPTDNDLDKLKERCEIDVISMGKHADDFHIIALSNALGVPFKIVSVQDSGDGILTARFYDVHPPLGAGQAVEFQYFFHLFHHSVHYDILYK